MKKSSLHLKKLFFLFFGLLVLCLCFLPIGLRVNASNAYSRIIFNISNDRYEKYFCVFSGNTGDTYRSGLTPLIQTTWSEDNLYFERNNLQKLYNNNYDYFDLLQDNEEFDTLYPQEFYLFAYSNYDRDYFVFKLTINQNVESEKTFNDITVDDMICHFYTDWQHGQLTDYTDKRILIYGQTLWTTQDNSSSDINNINYINNLFNNYPLSSINNKAINDIKQNAYNSGRTAGYNLGYSAGYNAGQAGENAISPFFRVLTDIFTSIGAIFSIELVPNIPLGLFILVPLFFAVLGIILWIWRRN